MAKRFSLLIASLICMISCEKNNVLDDSLTYSQTVPYHISLNDALTHLDSFLSEMNTSTKASGIFRNYSYDSIDTVSSSDIFCPTKSDSHSGDFAGDLFYIVNFDDSLGTAVLSADRRTDDIVLCVTESGSMNLKDFVNANNFMISEIESDIDENDDFCQDLGELTVPSLLLSSSIFDIYTYDSQHSSMDTKSLSSSYKYGPYLQTKWCQSNLVGSTENLFNRYTPNNYYAGCVVIAVAQILMKAINFTFTCSDGHVCRRDTMLTVANYLTPYYAGSTEAQIDAGKFVYSIGSSPLLCDVSYGANGSSSNATKAKRTFEAFLLRNVDKKSGFSNADKNNITTHVRSGKPIYMDGQQKWSTHGHAWVVDGEWGDYFHINWGWNGAYDGYFAKGAFDPQGGRETYTDSIDSGTYLYHVPETLKPYTWDFRYITYDL